MKIDLDVRGDSIYAMFKLTEERATDILTYMNMVCDRAYLKFEDHYSVSGIDENGDFYQHLAVGKIIREMMVVANNEYEKNYILYSAGKGIIKLTDWIAADFEEQDGED
jgi:hypothetical protein